MPEEIRVTDADTGGQKGTKGIRWSLLPWDQLRLVAQHYAEGAKKYAPWNWRKGYNWSLSYDSLNNHLTAFWMEHEWLDPETQTPHLAAVIFHAFALMFFHEHFPEKDDRPPVALPDSLTIGKIYTHYAEPIDGSFSFGLDSHGAPVKVIETFELTPRNAEREGRTYIRATRGMRRIPTSGEWFINESRFAGKASKARGLFTSPRQIINPVAD